MFVIRDEDGNVTGVTGSINVAELAELGWELDPAGNPRPAQSNEDLGKLGKADLVARADAAGVDSSGTKAEIIERLEALNTEGETT